MSLTFWFYVGVIAMLVGLLMARNSINAYSEKGKIVHELKANAKPKTALFLIFGGVFLAGYIIYLWFR